MREIERYRRQAQKHALRALGIKGDQVRGFVSEVQAAGQEAAILALPWAGGITGEEQPGQDPTTGALYFMADVDALGDPGAPLA